MYVHNDCIYILARNDCVLYFGRSVLLDNCHFSSHVSYELSLVGIWQWNCTSCKCTIWTQIIFCWNWCTLNFCGNWWGYDNGIAQFANAQFGLKLFFCWNWCTFNFCGNWWRYDNLKCTIWTQNIFLLELVHFSFLRELVGIWQWNFKFCTTEITLRCFPQSVFLHAAQTVG